MLAKIWSYRDLYHSDKQSGFSSSAKIGFIAENAGMDSTGGWILLCSHRQDGTSSPSGGKSAHSLEKWVWKGGEKQAVVSSQYTYTIWENYMFV